MDPDETDHSQRTAKRALYKLAMINTGIWAIAMIALVFLLEGNGNTRGLYPILAGGMAVGISLIASIAKLET
jgi:uncharacterized membrane protein YpjA